MNNIRRSNKGLKSKNESKTGENMPNSIKSDGPKPRKQKRNREKKEKKA